MAITSTIIINYNCHHITSNNRPGCITIFKKFVLLGSWPGHCLPFNTRRGCNLGPRAGLHMGGGGQNVLRKWDEHGINTETMKLEWFGLKKLPLLIPSGIFRAIILGGGLWNIPDKIGLIRDRDCCTYHILSLQPLAPGRLWAKSSLPRAAMCFWALVWTCIALLETGEMWFGRMQSWQSWQPRGFGCTLPWGLPWATPEQTFWF